MVDAQVSELLGKPNVVMNSRKYARVRLGVLKDLCADVILGQDFQARHKLAVFKYGGP